MRYRSPAAFRTALEARLKDEQTTEVGLSRLRKRVVFERLLARLVAVAPDAWVLKGGFALELRLGSSARSTRDVDVDRRLESADAAGLLRDAAVLELDDYFEFSVERASADDDLDGGGERWAVDTVVAGRLFERVAIDIGFGEPVVEPETVALSDLLAFAGLPPTTVRASVIEQHVAERLHAYTPLRTGTFQFARQGPRRSRRDRPHQRTRRSPATNLDRRDLRSPEHPSRSPRCAAPAGGLGAVLGHDGGARSSC